MSNRAPLAVSLPWKRCPYQEASPSRTSRAAFGEGFTWGPFAHPAVRSATAQSRIKLERVFTAAKANRCRASIATARCEPQPVVIDIRDETLDGQNPRRRAVAGRRDTV